MIIGKWSINPSSPLPYYYQLERFLKQEIGKAERNDGDELPAESEIAEACSVSLSVVRQALRRLEQEGTVIRKKGKRATVNVTREITLEFMYRKLSYQTELSAKGFSVRTRIMENLLILAEEDVAKALQIPVGQEVVKLSRLRSVDGRPTIFWSSYLPADLCKGLEEFDLKDKSLYEVLEEKYHLVPANAERSFQVLAGDPDICSLLNLHPGEPVVFIEWISFLRTGRPIEFYKGWHIANNCKFIFH
jgi:GntR family transcriptional regulator